MGSQLFWSYRLLNTSLIQKSNNVLVTYAQSTEGSKPKLPAEEIVKIGHLNHPILIIKHLNNSQMLV